MRRYAPANWVAALSLLLTLAALLFLALWPNAYQGEEVTLEPRSRDGQSIVVGTEEVRQTSASLIEENGVGALAVLMLPVLLAGVGLLAIRLRSRAGKALVWVSGFLLLLFAWASWLSIGPFYVPAALFSLVAAFFHTRTEERAEGGAGRFPPARHPSTR